MGRKAKKGRQSHGSVWHWKQTDSWYYTLPSTKKRVALFNEQVNYFINFGANCVRFRACLVPCGPSMTA